jgi:E3 ubiquitin-protein ligase MARCH6
MHVYPSIFAVAGFSRSVVLGVGLLSTWSQSVRDTEFLVEMRLRNLEPEKSAEKKVIVGSPPEGDASELSVD